MPSRTEAHARRARAVTFTEAQRRGYDTPFTSDTIGMALVPAGIVLALATAILIAIL